MLDHHFCVHLLARDFVSVRTWTLKNGCHYIALMATTFQAKPTLSDKVRWVGHLPVWVCGSSLAVVCADGCAVSWRRWCGGFFTGERRVRRDLPSFRKGLTKPSWFGSVISMQRYVLLESLLLSLTPSSSLSFLHSLLSFFLLLHSFLPSSPPLTHISFLMEREIRVCSYSRNLLMVFTAPIW